jgi:pimeloyl-ACP methyl ester carboxylesterase
MMAAMLTVLMVALLGLAGMAWESWAAARERGRIATTGEIVALGETVLHADLQGRRRSIDQPVVVMDGGLTNGSLTWPGVVRELGPDWLVLTYDRAGHLWSSLGPGNPSRGVEALLAEQRALLAAMHLAPPWLLVAHSCSGHTARLHAARYPEDVAALLLVETVSASQAASITRSSFARSLWWKVPAARFGLWRLWRWRKGLPPRPARVTPESMVAAWTRLSQSGRGLRATRDELAQLATDTAAIDAAPPPRQPCIILASTHGAVVVPKGMAAPEAHARALAAQRELSARLPGAELRVTDQSDHDIPWQAPGLVALAIRDLAARLPAAPARRG